MYEHNENQRILIVDDRVENIDVLMEVLDEQYMVIAARNGEKAIKMAKKKKPDLILLDIMMPDMDGYEVCRQLKQDDITKNIPVIFITALNEAMDETRAFNIGAVDYITKPFHPSVVKARVKTHMELKMKNDILETLAFLDGLTGIYNRRKFDETLKCEIKRSNRHKVPLSLILIDIDHFKLYNDNYGHAKGDDCLQRVAKKLKHTIRRPEDFLARYGGEEFVILLPGIDMNGAVNVAKKLRQGINQLALPHAFSPTAPHITLSSGVVSIDHEPYEIRPSALIQAADAMLYKSKENGRNRINGMVL